MGQFGAASGRVGCGSSVTSLLSLDGPVGPSSMFDCCSLKEALSTTKFVSSHVELAVGDVDDKSLLNVHVPGVRVLPIYYRCD